ncbi:hypothetical protein D3C87_952860 [compost metagenome]
MLNLYIFASVAFGLYYAAALLLDDWQQYKKYKAGGYPSKDGQLVRYNWELTVNWLIILAIGIPFINLFSLAFGLYLLWLQWSSRA